MLGELLEIVARIWEADSGVRESGHLGESDRDRRSRRLATCVLGGLFMILVAGILWFCLSSR